ISGLAVSQDGNLLLVSQYAGGGSVAIYDAHTYQLRATIGLGDFAGDIGFLSGNEVVAGSAGNPHLGGGGLRVIDLNNLAPGPFLGVPLAAHLTTFPAVNKVFSSSGNGLGVLVLTVDAHNNLVPTKTFVLGVNRYIDSSGRPHNEQIRHLFFKPAP